jgi:hypothetical protein
MGLVISDDYHRHWIHLRGRWLQSFRTLVIMAEMTMQQREPISKAKDML